jgi:hypothetical protein
MSARANRYKQLEPQFCPRRGEAPQGLIGGPDWWERGRWAATQEESDAEVAEFMAAHPRGGIGHVLWSYGGEQPRTCSYCGGIHPDDAITLIRAGWEVDPTTKSYKRYLEPPGYAAGQQLWREYNLRNGYGKTPTGEAKPVTISSPVPPVKLYVMHFTPDHIGAFNAALEARRG